MSFVPRDWNVVIPGSWNTAILTPPVVARNLLGLVGEEPFEVRVPFDGHARHHVRHCQSNLIVIVDERDLTIVAEKQNYETLAAAMEVGVNALDFLPKTPFTAAGFNLGFHAAEPPPDFAALFDDSVSTCLGRHQQYIRAHSVSKCIPHENGQINLAVHMEEANCHVSLNFHRPNRDREKLIEWLGMPIQSVESVVNRLCGALALEIEESVDDDE